MREKKKEQITSFMRLKIVSLLFISKISTDERTMSFFQLIGGIGYRSRLICIVYTRDVRNYKPKAKYGNDVTEA